MNAGGMLFSRTSLYSSEMFMPLERNPSHQITGKLASTAFTRCTVLAPLTVILAVLRTLWPAFN